MSPDIAADDHTLGLRALAMPLVTVGAQMAGVTCVRIDDVTAAHSAVNHLIHQGHETIAMLASLSDDPGLGFSASRDRRAAYRQAMTTAGFAEYDEMAIGALRTLRRSGTPVPGQVSVVGVDDHEMA